MSHHNYYKSKDGQTLIVALAFVLLLTILVVGLLNRSLSDLQIANAGDNQVTVDLAADNAISQIIIDLKQEIAAGSYAPGSGNPYNVPSGSSIYYPLSSQTAAPSLSLPSGFSTATGSGYENILKVSSFNIPFFSSSTHTTSTTNPNRASNILTTQASFNNRAMTQALWTKPCMTFTSTAVPSGVSLAPFPEPDWIYIARDGTNPVNFDVSNIYSAISPITAAPATGTIGTNPVLQRYSYIMYDEGSTLDMNVAGSPLNSSAQSLSTIAQYKNTLAYADLTQLPGLSTLTAGEQSSVINAIIGWRNNASSKATGNFPSYISFGSATAPSSLNPFDLALIANTTGFKQVSNTALNSNGNGMSDQAFTSRQQLIQLLQSVGTTFSYFTQSLQQQALTTMGTFTRDISQPSFAPNPNRPLIVGDYTQGGNTAYQADSSVNPPFSTIIVPGTQGTAYWIRNDGTSALGGEHLVKKRFALNRLAWITYEGPSALRSGLSNPGATGADADLYSLENTYGISQSWLQQGTASNIQKYFGLVWTSGYWTYSPTTGAGTTILSLSAVAALDNREPNFIEILRASILAGSIAKDFPTDISDTLQNYRYTYLDCSVLQIAANIIDQYDCDGYPTHIQFASNATFDIYGVENLPYLYRVRDAALTTGPTAGSTTGTPSVVGQLRTALATNYTLSTGTIITPGTAAVVQEIEVWNPHGWNNTSTAAINASMGNPRPTAFQLQVTPSSAVASMIYNYGAVNPGSPTSNPTTLSFNVPTGQPDLFREPTLLITPGIPTGSNLTCSPSLNVFGTPAAYKGVCPTGVTAGTDVAQPFAGVVLGQTSVLYKPGSTIEIAYQLNLASSAPGTISYGLSCAGPSGNISYDNKMGNTYLQGSGTLSTTPVIARFNGSTETAGTMADWGSVSTSQPEAYQDNMIAMDNSFSVFDPRTGRFGFQANSAGTYDGLSPAPRRDRRYGPEISWGSPAENITETERPSQDGGYPVGPVTTSPLPASYPPFSSAGWSWNTSLVHGLFAQNRMGVKYDETAFGLPTDYPNTNQGGTVDSPSPQYYSDADGVVRRAMAGHIQTGTSSAMTQVGQPLATAVTYNNTATGTQLTAAVANDTSNAATNTGILREQLYNTQYFSSTGGTIYNRPIVLNRPFCSVAELGSTFSDLPWRNLDMSSAESGFSGLLDAFCIQDTSDPNVLVAGKINLNTKQATVLNAVLSGAYEDTNASASYATLSSSTATSSANLLLQRTNSSATSSGPLTNLSELVGKQISSSPSVPVDGSSTTNFSGFSSDLDSAATSDLYFENIGRFREAPIRALAAAGTTRVWNLMIDVVAQTGKFPKSATALDQFYVEGERRYWVHLAIDRLTGKVLDKQVELVTE